MQRFLQGYDTWLSRPLWMRVLVYAGGISGSLALGAATAAVLPTIAICSIWLAEAPKMGGVLVRGWTAARRRHPQATAKVKGWCDRQGRNRLTTAGMLLYLGGALLTLGVSLVGSVPALIGASLCFGLLGTNFVYLSVRRYFGHQKAALVRSAQRQDIDPGASREVGAKDLPGKSVSKTVEIKKGEAQRRAPAPRARQWWPAPRQLRGSDRHLGE